MPEKISCELVIELKFHEETRGQYSSVVNNRRGYIYTWSFNLEKMQITKSLVHVLTNELNEYI